MHFCRVRVPRAASWGGYLESQEARGGRGRLNIAHRHGAPARSAVADGCPAAVDGDSHRAAGAAGDVRPCGKVVARLHEVTNVGAGGVALEG